MGAGALELRPPTHISRNWVGNRATGTQTATSVGCQCHRWRLNLYSMAPTRRPNLKSPEKANNNDATSRASAIAQK